MEDLNCLLGAEGQQQLTGWAAGEDTAHRICRERNRVHDTGRLGPFLALAYVLCTGWFATILNPYHLWGQKSWQKAPEKVRQRRRGEAREGRVERLELEEGNWEMETEMELGIEGIVVLGTLTNKDSSGPFLKALQ